MRSERFPRLRLGKRLKMRMFAPDTVGGDQYTFWTQREAMNVKSGSPIYAYLEKDSIRAIEQ